MRTPALALPPFKITVGSGSAAFTRLQTVGIHGQTHLAAWLAPFEGRIPEYFIQPFVFSLRFYQSRPWHLHGKLDAGRNVYAFSDGRSRAQILYARISAGANKHLIKADFSYWRVRLQAHILQGMLHAATLGRISLFCRVRHAAIN